MDLNQYQHQARQTALYPNVGSNPIYPTLGLAGEAGEVADKVKKVIRDKKGVFDKFSPFAYFQAHCSSYIRIGNK